MNFITQYGLRGLVLVVRVRVRAHFILQNLVLPYMCLEPPYMGPKMLNIFPCNNDKTPCTYTPKIKNNCDKDETNPTAKSLVGCDVC